MRRSVILFLTVIIVVIGCDGLYSDKIVGKYYLVSVDVPYPKNLSYDLGNGSYLGVVDDVVIEYGYNNDYIIVKQHPVRRAVVFPLVDTVDSAITNYYIIPLKYKLHKSPDENKIGPLSKKEFWQKRKELKISDKLKFIKVK